MTNQLTTFQWNANLPAHLRVPADMQKLSTLGAAFESRAFARISTRGNTFSLVNIEGEVMSVNQIDAGKVFLDLVFINWADHVTKTWYEGAFTDGSDDTPSCFSMDGKRPDPSSTNKQGDAQGSCALCPMNAFGSAANGKGKACADGQRTAVVLGRDTPVSINGAAGALKAGANVFGYRLPSMTGKNIARVRKEFDSAGANMKGAILRATFASQGIVDFKPVGWLGEAEYAHTVKLAASEEAQRTCGLDQKPVQYDAVPDHLRVKGPTEAEVAKAEAGFIVPVSQQQAPSGPVVVPSTAETTAPQPRRRGRPAQTAAVPPTTTATSQPAGAFSLDVPATQTSVIQQPDTNLSPEMAALLAAAMT